MNVSEIAHACVKALSVPDPRVSFPQFIETATKLPGRNFPQATVLSTAPEGPVYRYDAAKVLAALRHAGSIIANTDLSGPRGPIVIRETGEILVLTERQFRPVLHEIYRSTHRRQEGARRGRKPEPEPSGISLADLALECLRRLRTRQESIVLIGGFEIRDVNERSWTSDGITRYDYNVYTDPAKGWPRGEFVAFDGVDRIYEFDVRRIFSALITFGIVTISTPRPYGDDRYVVEVEIEGIPYRYTEPMSAYSANHTFIALREHASHSKECMETPTKSIRVAP